MKTSPAVEKARKAGKRLQMSVGRMIVGVQRLREEVEVLVEERVEQAAEMEQVLETSRQALDACKEQRKQDQQVEQEVAEQLALLKAEGEEHMALINRELECDRREVELELKTNEC